MPDTGKPAAVLFGDVSAVDGLACAYAAAHSHMSYDLKAVVVTGRPVGYDPKSGSDDYDKVATAIVHRRDCLRMKGFLSRAGRPDIPVFQGLVHPHTTIPPAIHVDTSLLDLHNDETSGRYQIDGDFTDALALIRGLPGPIGVLGGGPLTEVSEMLKDPDIASKLGTMAFQGPLLSGDNWPQKISDKPMGGGLRQFNVAGAPQAANHVFRNYPGQIYMVPSNVTRDPDLVFQSYEDLIELGVHNEIVEVCKVAKSASYGKAKRSGVIAMHDVELAILLGAVIAEEVAGLPTHERLTHGFYEFTPIEITKVPDTQEERGRWGEVGVSLLSEKAYTAQDRYIINSVKPGFDLSSAELHREAMKYFLTKPTEGNQPAIAVSDLEQHLYQLLGHPDSERFPPFRRFRPGDNIGYLTPEQFNRSIIGEREVREKLARTFRKFGGDFSDHMAQYAGDPKNNRLFMAGHATFPIIEGGKTIGGYSLGMEIMASIKDPNNPEVFLSSPIAPGKFYEGWRPALYDFSTSGRPVPTK